MSPTYRYPRPAVTVDCVVFSVADSSLRVLLIERGHEPFKGCWALPGGFVDPDEDLEHAARRELEEETGLRDIFLEQLFTFGEPGRDPRSRVISVAYFALINADLAEVTAASDAARAEWIPVDDAGSLAFDHQHILQVATERLRSKVRYSPLGFELLPRDFTLSQLQNLYEVVLGREVDKRNFRRRILQTGLLRDTGRHLEGLPHRAPKLFQFDRRRYRQLEREGLDFWL